MSDTPTPPAIQPLEITTTDCRRCGCEVSGIKGRYACTRCGWTSHWADGHGDLPTAQDDPDWPGHQDG